MTRAIIKQSFVSEEETGIPTGVRSRIEAILENNVTRYTNWADVPFNEMTSMILQPTLPFTDLLPLFQMDEELKAKIGSTARVRPGPNTDEEEITTLSVGVEVTIIGQTTVFDASGHLWYQVRFWLDGEEVTGWIRGDLLDFPQGTDPDISIQLYDKDGNPLSDEDAQAFIARQRELQAAQNVQPILQSIAAYYANQFNDEYGLDVLLREQHLVSTEYSYILGLSGSYGDFITFEDIQQYRDALEAISQLTSDEYGFTLGVGAGNIDGLNSWSPYEINLFYLMAYETGRTLDQDALELGFDLDTINPFQSLYGNQQLIRSNRLFPKKDENGDVVKDADGNTVMILWEYGWNTGTGTIYIGDNFFYDDQGNLFTEANLGALKEHISKLGFTGLVLGGHEVVHQANFRDSRHELNVVREGGLEERENTRLQTYYMENMATEHTFVKNHTFRYLVDRESNEIRTGEVMAGFHVRLGIDDGFEYAARSGNESYELVTDSLNAYNLNLYTIGEDHSYDENVAGLARREQGEMLTHALLIATFGNPDSEQ